MRRMRHLKPREIQGCQLALDASIATSLYDATSGGSLVAANGAVARWEDQSGNGYNVTQGTAAARPARRAGAIQGLDALQFDGGDYLTQSAASQSQYLHLSAGSTVVVVGIAGSISDPNAAYVFFGTNAASSNVGVCVFYDDRASISRNNVLASLMTNGPGSVTSSIADLNKLTPNSPAAIAIKFNNGSATASQRVKIRINGGAEYGTNSASDTPSAAAPTFAMQVGAAGNNIVPFVGYISSVAGWNSLLNDAVRVRMHCANMRKWRING